MADENYIPYDFPPFDQGQVSAASQAALYPGELYVCRNMWSRSRGILWMRDGMSLWNSNDTSLGEAGTGLFEVRDITGAIRQIKFTVSAIYELTGGQAGSWTDITGTATLSGDQNSLWFLIEHYGKVYATNGGKPIVWDFSSGGFADLSLANAPEAAGGVFSFMERLGFWDCTYGGIRQPNLVHISDVPGYSPVFSTTNQYALGPSTGNPVKGVIEKGGILRAGSYPRGTFSVYYDPQGEGKPAFTVTREDMTIGMASGHTLTSVDDWILFLDASGHARAWDTESGSRRTMRRLTMPIENVMQEDVHRGRNVYASATFVDRLGQYWLMVTEDSTAVATEHNLTVALRIPDKAPMNVDTEDEYRPSAPAFLFSNSQKWKLNFISCWTADDGRVKPVGVDYNGIVYDLWNGGGDVGTDVTAIAELPLSHYGMPGVRKGMENATIIFERGVDGDATVFVNNAVNVGQSVHEAEFTIRQSGVPIGEFQVGVSSIGSRGSQLETMQLHGLGERGRLKIRSLGQSRFGIGLMTVGTSNQGTPTIT